MLTWAFCWLKKSNTHLPNKFLGWAIVSDVVIVIVITRTIDNFAH